MTINEDTATRAGGLGFFWKHIAGDNSSAPLWSLDTITSNNVTLSGRTWTPPNSVTPVHDDDGNLTYDGRWDSAWDAENRLTRMQTTDIAAAAGVPRLRLDFVYDSQSRRVSKTVSTSTNGTTWNFSSNLRFLYDGWNLIAEYSAPSATSTTLTLQAAHLWGVDLSGTPQGAGGVGGLLCSTLQDYENSTTHSCYPAFDGNGNISAWVAENGSLLARMDYSPFGQLIAQYKFTQTGDDTLTRLPFGFSTKYTDKETGLLYYGFRYYDPVTGRWRSEDPIGELGGLNLHGFVGNDGMNRMDYIGMAWEEVPGTIKPTGKWILTQEALNVHSATLTGWTTFVVLFQSPNLHLEYQALAEVECQCSPGVTSKRHGTRRHSADVNFSEIGDSIAVTGGGRTPSSGTKLALSVLAKTANSAGRSMIAGAARGLAELETNNKPWADDPGDEWVQVFLNSLGRLSDSPCDNAASNPTEPLTNYYPHH